MEEFKVITKGLKNAGNDLIQISKNIRATESSINTIRSGLRNKIVREEEIGRRLKDISTAVDQIGGKLSQYGERVITISERYEQTERSITDFSKESVDGAVSAGIGVITDLAAGEASGQPDAAEGSDGTQKEFAFIKGEIEGNGSFWEWKVLDRQQGPVWEALLIRNGNRGYRGIRKKMKMAI